MKAAILIACMGFALTVGAQGQQDHSAYGSVYDPVMFAVDGKLVFSNMIHNPSTCTQTYLVTYGDVEQQITVEPDGYYRVTHDNWPQSFLFVKPEKKCEGTKGSLGVLKLDLRKFPYMDLNIKDKLFIVRNHEQMTPTQMAVKTGLSIPAIEFYMNGVGLPIKRETSLFQLRNNNIREYSYAALAEKRDFKNE